MEHGRIVRPEICGWSALEPIALFIENVFGFSQTDPTSHNHFDLTFFGLILL